MENLGIHLLVELEKCNSEKLDDIDFVKEALIDAAEFAGATVLHSHFHKFSPQGVSGAVIIAESHLTIHSWPEEPYRYAAIDIFTCGDKCKPWYAAAYLAAVFEGSIKVKKCLRGPSLHS